MSTAPPRRPRPEDLGTACWRKSSYSGGANDCVEVADFGSYAAIRDSKNRGGTPLVLARSAVDELLKALSQGPVRRGLPHF
ncbi:DUF397 domain-containing protein [Streptomyces sp. AK02-01A]|uniref:DUF397 domain-containing protein n=1 Tax=Streptomyces sp. AK02-01A TaxID=3028648 RepID=UPI0029B0FA99|nr:DUF397 domain-containing protein [Streptomyces sp. AK02-01A]MDX3854209.1 DUF397 domain-containing protein [Streptomyces sp. AK02-01A]